MGDALVILAIGVLVLLFGGEPDLADAIREMVVAQAKCK